MRRLIAATVFVALYFKLLATSDAAWVGWLPWVFPAIVAPCLALAGWSRTIRPKQIIPEAQLDTRAFASGVPASSGNGEFAVRGDAHNATGAWVVRYTDSVGREKASEARPSLEAAMAEARRLRDARGAMILEVVEQPG